MKKASILIALILTTGTFIAQQRGGRGGGNQSVYINMQQSTSNPVNNTNINNTFSGNVLVNNVVQTNVQVSNGNYNFNKQNEQANAINRNVNRNVNINMANEDVQTLSNVSSRGGNTIIEPVSRGNNYEVPQVVEQSIELDNVVPRKVEVELNDEPIQQQMVIDNVDNQLSINVNPNINVNVPQINANVDFSIDMNRNQQAKNTSNGKEEKVKEPRVKEDKQVNLNLSVKMPEVSLKSSGKSTTSKKVAKVKTKKTKKHRGYGYKQHVSIFAKIAAKTEGIKKLLKKKKKKKVTCSVVCYKF